MSAGNLTNREKALLGEVVLVTDSRLVEMQKQVIRGEGVGEGSYHWHWAAVINELIAKRFALEKVRDRYIEHAKTGAVDGSTARDMFHVVGEALASGAPHE